MLTDTEIYAAELRMWRERFEQHLDQVPVILETLRDQAHPLKAARLAEKVSGGGGEAPLPFRADPVDDCDDLWASLVEFVGEVAERLQEPSPGAAGASWGVQGSVRGIGAGVDGDRAYKAGFALIAWLIDRAQKIHWLGLRDSEDHLFGLIRKLMGRYVAPPIERPSRRRQCVVCGEFAVVVDWVLGGTGEAVCRTCGATYAPEQGGEGDE
ncbi:hypothetical protein AB0E56_13145 [Microbacterium sp. NPDC028030]|uniref:hypothetical protein n=1 Tax=Microbacterium sp. NPDC028030 TaxID=3155124 RepID=UPI0033F02EA2